MNEYQAMAQRTAYTKTKSGKIENGILGLCGETGECADLWKKYLHQGHELDTDEMLNVVIRAVDKLGGRGVKPYRIFCYLLVQDVQSARMRAEALRKEGVEVFAQPYRDFENSIEPTREMKDFARWVNHKAIFKTVRWEDYKRAR